MATESCTTSRLDNWNFRAMCPNLKNNKNNKHSPVDRWEVHLNEHAGTAQREGLGGGGALGPPLFRKNKNKLDKKSFNKNNGAKNSKKSLIRK